MYLSERSLFVNIRSSWMFAEFSPNIRRKFAERSQICEYGFYVNMNEDEWKVKIFRRTCLNVKKRSN